MMTDTALAKLYQDACAADDRALDGVEIADLIDLAEGRLSGERRFQLVAAIAQSPQLASAYRMAKASGEWSRALAADMARESAPVSLPRAVPRQRPALRRQRFAMAAAVSAMAIGAVFIGQRLQAPAADDGFATAIDTAAAGQDSILAASFGANGDQDVIFSMRSEDRSDDRIFSFGGGGS